VSHELCIPSPAFQLTLWARRNSLVERVAVEPGAKSAREGRPERISPYRSALSQLSVELLHTRKAYRNAALVHDAPCDVRVTHYRKVSEDRVDLVLTWALSEGDGGRTVGIWSGEDEDPVARVRGVPAASLRGIACVDGISTLRIAWHPESTSGVQLLVGSDCYYSSGEVSEGRTGEMSSA